MMPPITKSQTTMAMMMNSVKPDGLMYNCGRQLEPQKMSIEEKESYEGKHEP